jgi:tRNA1(Val) A37 N6-methylase TrmN6
MKLSNNQHIVKMQKKSHKIVLEDKKRFGQFFTSNRITKYIIDEMDLDEIKTVADLSCGDGAFLIECYDYLENLKIPPNKILENIYGVEITKRQLKNAKENLTNKSIKNKNIIEKNLILKDTISTTTEKILENFPKISKQKGFDVIVGNPPYRTIESSKMIKSDPIFSRITKGQINMATLMIGRAYSMLKNNGRLGLLLPKSILRVSSYEKLRNFITSKFKIEQMIDVGIEFDDVRGEQFILIATKKSEKPSNIKVGYFLKNKPFETHQIPFNEITKFENFLLLDDKETYRLVDKIISDHPNLEQVSNGKIFRGIGIGANSKYVSKNPTENHFKSLRGDSIKKFSYNYLIHVEKRDFAKIDMVRVKKIVLQNIFSSESGIIANYDKEGLVTLDTVTNILLENRDPYYVLGILNSSLMRFFMVFVVYTQSRLTMHTDRRYINRIPIPKTSSKLEKAVIAEVKNQIKEKSSFLKLNDLIFEVFGLNDIDIKQVKRQLEKFEKRGKKNG